MAPLRYLPEIDGLRAVAVLAVLVYHAVPGWLPAGFVGVDVFFVISGYLITSILVAEHAATGRIDLPGFYARRARRLLPALGVVVLATVGLAMAVAPLGAYVHEVMESAAASLLFAGNVYFQLTSGGYFDGPAEELPLLHLWSLGVEEQFYLVFPAVLLVVLRLGRRGAMVALGALALASLGLAEFALVRWPDAAFYQMPFRFWELAAGALVAMSSHRLRSGWLAAAGLALIAWAVAMPAGRFPGLGALPPVLGAVLFLLPVHGGLAIAWPRPMVAIGKWSYALYLWHWPLLALDRATTLGEPPAWRLLGWCAVAMVLAALSHRYLEQPAIRRLAREPSRRVVKLAAASLAGLVLCTLVAHRQYEPPQGLAEAAGRAMNDRPPFMADCHFGIRARVGALLGCRSAEAEPTVAIWGDSHALAWAPFAWELARSRGTAATLISMDSCPPVAAYTGDRADAPSHRENCARLNRMALQALPRFDTVVVAARWTSSMGGQALVPAAEFDAGLDAALGQLASVREVLVLLPAPELPHPAPKCILSRREGQCAQSIAEAQAARAGAVARLQAVAARHPNVRLVDPLPYFCPGGECPVRKAGVALFWDDDHVSTSAARGFAAWALADRGGL